MRPSLDRASPWTPVYVGFLLALVFVRAEAPLPPGADVRRAAPDVGQAHEHRAAAPGPAGTPLTEPGNAAFAAIREAVDALEAREDTDWTRVDLEGLRRHLRDMHRFTLEAEVVEREPVERGIRVAVRGVDAAASDAVRRAVHAHGPFLERETGWSVDVTDRGAATVLRVTGASASDARKIRGLGYIGLMATGAHHRRHHWMIATGRSPHGS